MRIKQLILICTSFIITGIANSSLQAQTSDPIVQQRREFIEATPAYDWEKHHGLMPIIKNNKFGFINQQGEVVLSPKYDDIGEFSEGLALAKKDDRFYFIDKHGKVVLRDLNYQNVSDISAGLIKVKQGDLIGFIDTKKAVIYPPSFSYTNPFEDNMASVKKTVKLEPTGEIRKEVQGGQEKKFGVISNTGDVLIQFKYDKIRYLKHGLFRMWKGAADSYAIVVDGKAKILDYDEVWKFTDGFAKVRKGDHWGLIDKNARVVVPTEYQQVFGTGSLLLLEKDGKTMFADSTGRLLDDTRYDRVGLLNNGRRLVHKDGYWGYVNAYGRLVIPMQAYERVGDFSEGFAIVKKANKYGFINTNGDAITAIEFEKADKFNRGFARVKRADKWGYINQKGEVVIPMEYDYLAKISDDVDGLIVAKKDNKHGLIDTANHVVFPIQHEWVIHFSEGIACLGDVFKYNQQFIDQKGNCLMPKDSFFEEAKAFSNGLAEVRKNRKWGMINTKGAFVIPTDYWYVERISKDFILAKKDNAYHLYNTKGKLLFSDYDQVTALAEGLLKLKKNESYDLYAVDGFLLQGCYSISMYKDELIMVSKDGKVSIYNQKGMKLE